jgi:hypothetical protein
MSAPGYLNPETDEAAPSIELELIPGDDGNVEAARFRVSLAMVATMLAEVADQHGGSLPAGVLHEIAGDVIRGTERGLSFCGGVVGRMMAVRFTISEAPGE